MKNRDNRLGQEQHEHLKVGVNWSAPFRLAYFMAVGLLIWVGYAEHLEQTGDESKVPAVVDQVEQIKQQIPIPRGSTRQDLKDMGDLGPEENGWPPPAKLSRHDITMGRTIHLELIFQDIGIQSRLSDIPDSQWKAASDKYKFLKRLIYGKLGEPPIRGTQEEWDAYVDTIYAFDWTKWIA